MDHNDIEMKTAAKDTVIEAIPAGAVSSYQAKPRLEVWSLSLISSKVQSTFTHICLEISRFPAYHRIRIYFDIFMGGNGR